MVCAKSGVYVFGGFYDYHRTINQVEKYSFATNRWNVVADMYDNRHDFCACSFMDNIYVIGGLDGEVIDSCLEFNTKNHEWKEVDWLHEERALAACSAFEGRVVVTGGYSRGDRLDSVEVYDHVADEWSSMPHMNEERYAHKSVAIKNKLFVVGGWNTPWCEVFDSTCDEFVMLKPLRKSFERYLIWPVEVLSIGSKLFVFSFRKEYILIYDIETGEWSEELCEMTRYLEDFCCAKLPQL